MATMENQLSNAYTYMFKSKDWFLKLAIFCLFNLPSAYFIFLYQGKELSHQPNEFYIILAVAIISMLINMGYSARCTQNLIHAESIHSEILPKWHGCFLEYFELGIKKVWFYVTAGLAIFPMMFQLRNYMSPDAGIDFALDGLFCQDFNSKRKFSDFESVLEEIRLNLGFYYKMSFMNFVIPMLLVFSVIIMSKYSARVEYAIALLCIAISYYFFTSAYFASASAKNFGFDSTAEDASLYSYVERIRKESAASVSEQPVQESTVNISNQIQAFGKLAKEGSQLVVLCPNCGMKYGAEIINSEQIKIRNFDDSDLNQSGQQIDCLKCGQTFTIEQINNG